MIKIDFNFTEYLMNVTGLSMSTINNFIDRFNYTNTNTTFEERMFFLFFVCCVICALCLCFYCVCIFVLFF